MTAETPDSIVHALASDRRPAIWPWLVMPLITLLVFYWLYSLDQVSGQVGGLKGFDLAPESTSAHPRASDSTEP